MIDWSCVSGPLPQREDQWTGEKNKSTVMPANHDMKVFFRVSHPSPGSSIIFVRSFVRDLFVFQTLISYWQDFSAMQCDVHVNIPSAKCTDQRLLAFSQCSQESASKSPHSASSHNDPNKNDLH
jgi:hypothetical protein